MNAISAPVALAALALLATDRAPTPAPIAPRGIDLFAAADHPLARDIGPMHAGEPQVLRERAVYVEVDPLAGLERPGDPRGVPEHLSLGLFTDVTVDATLDRVVSHEDGSRSWIGHRDGSEDRVVLTGRDGVLAGRFEVEDQVFALHQGPSGSHVITEIDPSFGVCGIEEGYEPAAPLPDWSSPADLHAGAFSPTGLKEHGGLSATTGEPIDVLVLYTEPARARVSGGANDARGIETYIQMAALFANMAYEDSRVDQRIRVVHTRHVPTSVFDEETADVGACRLVERLSSGIGPVDELRETYGADVVVLVYDKLLPDGKDSTSVLGCGTQLTERNTGNGGAKGFAAVKIAGFEQFTFTHELGHVMGAGHGRNLSGEDGWGGYGYGYNDGRTDNRTIMSRAPGSDRRNRFSNPDVTFPGSAGRPTGVSFEADPKHAADNARVLRQTTSIVRSYRSPVSHPSDARAHLTLAEGGQLQGASHTFAWQPTIHFDPPRRAAPWVTYNAYHLEIGSTRGASDLGTVTVRAGDEPRATVSGLPTDGRVVHVRLWTQVAGGSWQFEDRTFRASGG